MDAKRRWLGSCVAGLVMLAGASTAEAATQVYPTLKPQRTFDSGPAGWTPAKFSEGLCVPLLLCPTITNSYQATGGAVNNGGYIRTSLGSLTGVGATSGGIWTSPAFRYRGVDGKQPDSVKFKLARRANVQALLAVTGNSATYTVKLVNVSGHANVTVIEEESLGGASGWSEIPAVSVDPSLLKVGDRYQVRITSRFVSGVQVLPGGAADYDRVRLSARVERGGGGTGSGGTGGGGTGGGGGGGSFFGNGGGQPFVTAVKRNNQNELRVTVRCARKPKFRCKARIDARLRRSGPQVTNSRTVRIRPGQRRRVTLDIRRRYRDEVVPGSRIVIKQRSKLRGDRHAKTVYKRLRIRSH